MALFRNPPVGSGQVGVKLRFSLCDVLSYVSARIRELRCLPHVPSSQKTINHAGVERVARSCPVHRLDEVGRALKSGLFGGHVGIRYSSFLNGVRSVCVLPHSVVN